MKPIHIDWDDDQLHTLETYVAPFRLAKEAERQNVVDGALEELKKLPLRGLEDLTEKVQKEVPMSVQWS